MLTVFITLLFINIITSCLLILATYSFARQMYNESKRQQLVIGEMVKEAEKAEGIKKQRGSGQKQRWLKVETE